MTADGERRAVRLRPGEFALTEWRGRFFGVGHVVGIGGGRLRAARCCEPGHADEGEVDGCWAAMLEASGA